jgi:hypothetical protein
LRRMVPPAPSFGFHPAAFRMSLVAASMAA